MFSTHDSEKPKLILHLYSVHYLFSRPLLGPLLNYGLLSFVTRYDILSFLQLLMGMYLCGRERGRVGEG